MKSSPSPSASEAPAGRSWCLAIGLVALPAWLLAGLVLEGLHGFKSRAYLDDELRREMWTLAHAHGTLFALAAIVVALLLPRSGLSDRVARFVDRAFAAGGAALPVGFLLGGWWHSESDPGLGILLVPAGGLLAGAALVVLALTATRRWPQP